MNELSCPICAAARRLCPQCRRKFYPAKVIQGRQARMLSRRTLAKEMGLSDYRMKQIETGVMRPSEEEILRLGTILKFPRAFFTRPPVQFTGPTFACQIDHGFTG